MGNDSHSGETSNAYIENENLLNNINEPTTAINSGTSTPSTTVTHITDVDSWSSDPALWPNKKNQVVQYWIHRGRLTPNQNLNNDFTASSRVQKHDNKTRTCSPNFFYFTTKNGETVNREWLIYSPSTGNIFCFYCILFGNPQDKFSSGYSDWPHGQRDINKHE